MSIEQKLNKASQEDIINKESSEKIVPIEISEEDKQTKLAEKVQKEKENKEEITKKRKEIMVQLGGQESKEEYPEGNILNPQTLDNIAQLEAIDVFTLEFNQQRYDQYINSAEGKTRIKPQDLVKEAIEEGEDTEDAYGYAAGIPIYGKGGMNRYKVDISTGKIILDRGSNTTSGSKEYRTKLIQKAKELGFIVEGQ